MIDKFIERQIGTALAQLPPPPAGFHYVAGIGDIVYNSSMNTWEYDLTFKLVPDGYDVRVKVYHATGTGGGQNL